MTRRAFLTAVATAAAAAAAAAGCSARTVVGDSPGTNLRIGDVAVRDAHLDGPGRPGGYQVGDDVALYLWLYNESGARKRITRVSSTAATTVSLTARALPVTLPPGTLIELGPFGPHFVLRDIIRPIRGAVFVPVTVTLDDGSAVTFDVEPIDVGPAGSPQPAPVHTGR